MRISTLALGLLAATLLSGCIILFDDEQDPPPKACGWYCNELGCWESCPTTPVCNVDFACSEGVCDTDPDSPSYGACVVLPEVGCATGQETCEMLAPQCPSGQVPLSSDGCFTGECAPLESCDAPPPCSFINEETQCLERSDCGPTYTGLSCTQPDGAACTSGSPSCTCESYVFATCEALEA